MTVIHSARKATPGILGACLVSGSIWLAGCTSGVPSMPSIPGLGSAGGSQDRVKYGDVGTRETLQVHATTEDFKELAQIVTGKFLRSDTVQEWGKNGQKPRLIVGHLVNNTDDESIRMADVYDIIQNRLIQSGTVRIMDPSATEFDFIVKTELTSTRQYSKEGEELYHMTLQSKLFKLDGELTGQWSHEVKKIKEKRRLY
jgi:penicillin-binding protein activator